MYSFSKRRNMREHLRIAQELLKQAEAKFTDGREKPNASSLALVAIANVVVGMAVQIDEDRRQQK